MIIFTKFHKDRTKNVDFLPILDRVSFFIPQSLCGCLSLFLPLYDFEALKYTFFMGLHYRFDYKGLSFSYKQSRKLFENLTSLVRHYMAVSLSFYHHLILKSLDILFPRVCILGFTLKILKFSYTY